MNFNNPNLDSLYADMLEHLKARDVDIAKWLDGTDSTNLPTGVKKWNSDSNRFEKLVGSSWEPLTNLYDINVRYLNGCAIDNNAEDSSALWTAPKIISALDSRVDVVDFNSTNILNLVKAVDGAGSGLDADTVDGFSTNSSNVGSTIVLRDASGNFSAGTITANLSGSATSCSGNSATATKLATARTITLSGGVSGSTSFDGTGNVNISSTVANDSHYHSIGTISGLQSALDSKLSSVPAATSSTLGGVKLNFVGGTLYITT